MTFHDTVTCASICFFQSLCLDCSGISRILWNISNNSICNKTFGFVVNVFSPGLQVLLMGSHTNIYRQEGWFIWPNKQVSLNKCYKADSLDFVKSALQVFICRYISYDLKRTDPLGKVEGPDHLNVEMC